MTETPNDEQEWYRREAMGAFAHEVRTPLTSIRMVLELARRDSGPGQLVLDGELAAMLASSVDDLQQLADDLQETSRLERSKAAISRGPCDLHAAIEAAAVMLAPDISLEGAPFEYGEGPWDPPRLVRAISGFALSANRIGDGSGVVRYSADWSDGHVSVTLVSGKPGTESRSIAADAGFGFFRSRQFILAIGGSLEWERTERYVQVRLRLPL